MARVQNLLMGPAAMTPSLQIAGGQTDDCAGAHPAQQVGLHDGQRAGCLGFIEDHEQDGARQAVL